MFSILGQEALYVELAAVFKKRIAELANPEDEKEAYLLDVLGRSDVTYMFNAIDEVHTFFIRIPKDITPEQIQTMADAVLAILGRTVEKVPCVAVDDTRQKYNVIITNYEEPEIIGLHKTEGFSSGEVFRPIFDSLGTAGRQNPNFDRSHPAGGEARVLGAPRRSGDAVVPVPGGPAVQPRIEQDGMVRSPVVGQVAYQVGLGGLLEPYHRQIGLRDEEHE